MSAKAARLGADEIIAKLGLKPHPEGGHFAETFRDEEPIGKRGHSSAIYYLLRRNEVSRWHRVDAAEIWHWHAGDSLKLSFSVGEGSLEELTLGPQIEKGQRPQAVVPRNAWQSARSLGEWTLVGCTVSPAFEFEGLEIAPHGWSPGDS